MIVLPKLLRGNENPSSFLTYIHRDQNCFRATFSIPTARRVLPPASGFSTMETVSFPRPLTDDEHDLIEALLGAVRSGVSRYIGQLASAEVVGGCRCGCPSIDLEVDSAGANGMPTPVILADAESPEGVSVGIILWARSGRLSALEVHPWDGSAHVRLPRPDTLCNLRTAD